jgi:hypothetical protein
VQRKKFQVLDESWSVFPSFPCDEAAAIPAEKRQAARDECPTDGNGRFSV